MSTTASYLYKLLLESLPQVLQNAGTKVLEALDERPAPGHPSPPARVPASREEHSEGTTGR